jgi:hypothetical protein
VPIDVPIEILIRNIMKILVFTNGFKSIILHMKDYIKEMTDLFLDYYLM